MSRLLDDDQELDTQQRELTLSTGAILAIFLGLVLLCAVFFGFGYNLGRKSTSAASAPAIPAASDSEPSSTDNSRFDNFKPSPVSPTGSAPSPAASSTPPPNASVVETAPARTPPRTTPATPRPSQPAPAAAEPPASAHAPAAPATTPGGSFVVQIAAISSSHKDDADLLVNALHNKGYAVAERVLPQDKLIHIQVGPFATKADAEAMRERLIVDGYNAIVK
jgi:cell division septation protein DedD